MDGDVPKYTPGLKKVFVPRNELMPAGFRMLRLTNPEEEARAPGPRTRFIVSDGIAWVSVFVERADKDAARAHPGTARARRARQAACRPGEPKA